MTGKKRVVRILLVAGAILLGAFLWPRDHEPSYQGRTLSEWLIAYTDNPSLRDQATNAVHHIGTNALPLLVHWVTYKQSRWSRTLNSVAIRIGGRRLLRIVSTSDIRAFAALTGLEILGPEAAPAVPALTNQLSWDWRARGVNDRIFLALNHVGNAGLAPLVSVVTNKTVPGDLRDLAATRIRDQIMRVDTNANWVVPVLADCLNDRVVAIQVVAALGDLRLEPAVAVSALTRCLKNDFAPLRPQAAISLGRFGKDAAPAVPDLVEALGSKDKYVRVAATNALEQIAPEVLKKEGH